MTSGIGNRRGFTFIEIILVVALIAVMAALSAPQAKKTFHDLQLQASADKLEAFMRYLRERAIVEGEVILLTVDLQKKEYWWQAQGGTAKSKVYVVPGDILLESDKKEIFFYPDGNIDKVTLKLSYSAQRTITLTTEGIFGGVRLQEVR